MHIDENPVATMPDYRKPDAICETCETELFDDSNRTARQQQSECGRYCEECILKHCDTRANRQRYLIDNGLYNDYIRWAAEEYWLDQLNITSSHYDVRLHYVSMGEFINVDHDHDYFVWLMETN